MLQLLGGKGRDPHFSQAVGGCTLLAGKVVNTVHALHLLERTLEF